jgi:hypothetical protein
MAVCLWLTPFAFVRGYSPELGHVHDDFRLPRIDNRQPVRLFDFRGKKLILIQFASW